ncbi:uncharacterized protein isoform X2 [Choristoneura fumiferana]|uniref:uncharacterized protein isoform X2 n=1 Tax=Choristoneura fumiferana TaxID=7141 RepID=UPI003D15828B
MADQYTVDLLSKWGCTDLIDTFREYNTNGGKELEATFLELYKCYLLSFFEDDDLLETHWCSRPSEGLLDVLYLPYLTFFKTAKPEHIKIDKN